MKGRQLDEEKGDWGKENPREEKREDDRQDSFKERGIEGSAGVVRRANKVKGDRGGDRLGQATR